MLIWVNGPFGGGKTQTAYELRRRLPGSIICDPELVGFGLQRMTPRALRRDFQDFPAWRQGVYEVLDLALTRSAGHVIAPMTLVEPAYFEAIVGGLRRAGHPVHHVALLADPQVVRRRLRERAVGRLLQRWVNPRWTPRRESFAAANLPRCLSGLAGPMLAEHLWTDDLTIPQVAERIAADAGLTLLANPSGPVHQRLWQSWTSLRQVRLD